MREYNVNDTLKQWKLAHQLDASYVRRTCRLVLHIGIERQVVRSVGAAIILADSMKGSSDFGGRMLDEDGIRTIIAPLVTTWPAQTAASDFLRKVYNGPGKISYAQSHRASEDRWQSQYLQWVLSEPQSRSADHPKEHVKVLLPPSGPSTRISVCRCWRSGKHRLGINFTSIQLSSPYVTIHTRYCKVRASKSVSQYYHWGTTPCGCY